MRIACASNTAELIKQKFLKDDIVEINFRYDFDQYHLLRFTWDTDEKFDILTLDPEKFRCDLSSVLFESKKFCKILFLIDDGFVENDYKELLVDHHFKKVRQVEELVHGFCYNT